MPGCVHLFLLGIQGIQEQSTLRASRNLHAVPLTPNLKVGQVVVLSTEPGNTARMTADSCSTSFRRCRACAQRPGSTFFVRFSSVVRQRLFRSSFQRIVESVGHVIVGLQRQMDAAIGLLEDCSVLCTTLYSSCCILSRCTLRSRSAAAGLSLRSLLPALQAQ